MTTFETLRLTEMDASSGGYRPFLPKGWKRDRAMPAVAVRSNPVGIAKEVLHIETNEVLGEIKSPHRNQWFFKKAESTAWRSRKGRCEAIEGLLEVPS